MRRWLLPGALCLLVSVHTGCDGCAAKRGTKHPGSRSQPFARCLGDHFEVDLLAALDALPESTPSAHREQLRDWVWTTLLSRLAARRSEPELLAAVARQPLFRDDSLAHLLEMPVGSTRSAPGKDGTVYVLVDRSRSRAYDDVLEAADQEALVLGATPRAVEIYGVDFQMEKARAEVCKLGSVGRAWLQAPARGFRHTRVATASDLARFLDRGVDLLSASCTAANTHGALEVTGRRRPRSSRAPIAVAHIAALNQQPSYMPLDRLPPPLGRLTAAAREETEQIARQVDVALLTTRTTGRQVSLRGEDAYTQRFLDTLRAWKRQFPEAATRDLALSLRTQLHDDLGFSLDPRTSTSAGERVRPPAGYQCARYDGPLQGTEAGMTMFYTDLVAKLWAIDRHGSTPSRSIPGFVSVPEYPVSTAYCKSDSGVPHTRIWFGSRQEGFLRDAGDRLRFAPIAVRLFAMGSARGAERSEEVEPAANMLRFIRWWDRHYADVARWEPQYDLLDQLVKWTLVKRMAEASGSSACLAFLNAAPHGTDQRFDQWVARHRELRWRGPVPIVERSSETTECLPLLSSSDFPSCGMVHYLFGGVGLPGRREVAERPIRERDPSPPLEHFAPEKRAERDPSGGIRYSTIPGARGDLRDAELNVSSERVRFAATLKSKITLRGEQGWYRARDDGIGYEKVIQFADDGRRAEGRQRLDDSGVGRLTMTDLTSAAPHLAAVPGPHLAAQRLALDLAERLRAGATAQDLASAARRVAGELPVLALDNGWVVAVMNLPGEAEPTYAVMSSGGNVRGPPPPGPSFFTGPLDEGPEGPSDARTIQVVLLPRRNAEPYLRDHSAHPIELDPFTGAVYAHLRQGDFDAARHRVDDPAAPSEAVAAVAAEAVKLGRYAEADRLVDRIPWHGENRSELRRVERAAAKALVELARGSGDLQARARLETLQLRLAIAGRRLGTAAAERWRLRADKHAPFYLAEGIARPALLPPVGHPPGTPLRADQRSVDEVINAALLLRAAPRALQAGGLKFRLIESPPSSAQAPEPPEIVGSPYRLVPPPPGVAAPIHLVVPCTVDPPPDDDTWPPYCYRTAVGGPPPPEARMRALMTALASCDLNHDGRLAGDDEEACLAELARQHPEIKRLARRPPSILP